MLLFVFPETAFGLVLRAKVTLERVASHSEELLAELPASFGALINWLETLPGARGSRRDRSSN